MSSRRPRVASLLPAATEIVCALGLEEALVGVSHECDYPASVARLPVLTRPRGGSAGPLGTPSTLDGGSRSIDEAIRRALREGLSVFEVDVPALERVRPDIVVTQDLCEVCAVSIDEVRAAVRTIDAEVVSLHPVRLADILDDIRRVGAALSVGPRAETLASELASRLDSVHRRATATAARPSVLTVEWLDPVMIGGTWMPELVELAGGTPLAARPGEPAPTLDRDALSRLSPDIVLVKPCGFRLERTRREAPAFLEMVRDLGWKASVWLADGNAYFNRPGPRIVESLEILAACVRPEEFADLARRHAAVFERILVHSAVQESG
jgi:iron complex transport system substrate-binding protein